MRVRSPLLLVCALAVAGCDADPVSGPDPIVVEVTEPDSVATEPTAEPAALPWSECAPRLEWQLRSLLAGLPEGAAVHIAAFVILTREPTGADLAALAELGVEVVTVAGDVLTVRLTTDRVCAVVALDFVDYMS